MYYPPVDYDNKEVYEAMLILEQCIPHETNKDYSDALIKALAIMRAISKIGRGTEWLSKLSRT